MEDAIESQKSFFKHMTDLDSGDKAGLMNMLQYTLIAIIPIVLVLKLIKTFTPQDNEDAASLEILAEVIGQISFMVLSIWFIDRMIQFIPTYSGVKYKPMDCVSFLLGFLMILMTMQTRLGAKINILIDRVVQLWNGETSIPKQKNKNNNNVVKVSQPLSGLPPQVNTNAALPPPTVAPNAVQQAPPQKPNAQNFNDMYQQSVPMAANDSLGGFTQF